MAGETTISDVLDRIRALAAQAAATDGLSPSVREALAAIMALTEGRQDVAGETSDLPMTESQSL